MIAIRAETNEDFAAIAQVNVLAFGTELEAQLVDELRAGGYARLSLVAEVEGKVVGHILFSRLAIHTAGGVVEALSLAPMAVLPTCQRQGIGTRLVQEGLSRCAEEGHKIVVVLGHREYYPRLGFSAQLAGALASPYSGESWMALELAPGALDGVAGRVEYPPPFTAFE